VLSGIASDASRSGGSRACRAGPLRDEFQRALLLRSFVWATVITMAVVTIWGFVELRAHGTVPHMGVIWVPMLLVCLTAAAKLLIFRQYRPASE
jgi:hypothetical protein